MKNRTASVFLPTRKVFLRFSEKSIDSVDRGLLYFAHSKPWVKITCALVTTQRNKLEQGKVGERLCAPTEFWRTRLQDSLFELEVSIS